MIYWFQNRTVAVAIEGRKARTAIVVEADGIRTIKISNTETLRPVEYRGKPYPIRKALAHYRRLAKKPGTTKGAKKALRRLAA